MNQIIEELKVDNAAMQKIIADLSELTGHMTNAYLGRLVREQQTAIDRQEIVIAGLKRELKALTAAVEKNATAITREGDKRQLAVNVIEDRHARLVERLKAKFENGEAK